MSGFDDLGVYFSGNIVTDEDGDNTLAQSNVNVIRRRFKDFLRQFHSGDFQYKYRNQLKEHYNIEQYWIEVSLDDLASYDEELADHVNKSPIQYLKIFETTATELADEITRPRVDEENVKQIQVVLSSDANPTSLREVKSDTISKLVKVPGIIVSSSNVRSKATKVSLQCRGCQEIIKDVNINPGLEGYLLPRKCNTDQTGRLNKCPVDPYFIIPDKCECIDYQVLKLQETPESVPHGEMPRHLQLFCDRYLCDKVVPGNRVTVLGIFSIKKISKPSTNNVESKVNVGIRAPYLRVLGIYVENEGPGRSGNIPYTPEDEELFRHLANSPNIYERITNSIAPSIFGSNDIKKALACLLFGGSRKRLPDGLTRRGDINILLLGDPGTAKSQLLKFVENISPIGVYTSGKGSSAAGLTASVIRDPSSRNFVMEGGAMVLADGGVVCIDEFDKMREDDRVAIHEAMEQQTISIAKAGITTTLNSRCAVLAAANSVFGRWDDTKADQNIDFMPTILSRFDMIFIVKDEHNERRDATIASHVLDVHMNAQKTIDDSVKGELSLLLLKKYIAYSRSHCGPRLSAAAAEKLKRQYVIMRNGSREQEKESSKKSPIPITIRQLEAIVRISESLAKMQLQPFVNETHVDEALRLFRVSTLAAAMSGDLSGAEGFTTEEEHQKMIRIEKQLKRRFPVGTQISEQSIIQDLVKQNFGPQLVSKVIYCMIRKGELQPRMQRKMLYRLK
ncbi:DNA replication licensing factor mcm5-A [Dermatophagoides farinae]|uniref:DNA replication licensing factor MCM5 n=1 Tax=Dermatophagoides farinae TaxID=6954 RepID=A0A922L2G5_DERFA|nr:DNA replication licensing factor mcm5-A-like [Dermatophagoides farinae]KAH7645851.1 dna replication licensing factor mcm5-a-like protein [Dermatophagoides farinae]KAH9516073.1 minichromosome maintenance protein 5 [Dermatophagoides farinae]